MEEYGMIIITPKMQEEIKDMYSNGAKRNELIKKIMSHNKVLDKYDASDLLDSIIRK